MCLIIPCQRKITATNPWKRSKQLKKTTCQATISQDLLAKLILCRSGKFAVNIVYSNEYSKTKKHEERKKDGEKKISLCFTFNNLYAVVDSNQQPWCNSDERWCVWNDCHQIHSIMRDLSTIYVYIIQPWYLNVFQQVPRGRWYSTKPPKKRNHHPSVLPQGHGWACGRDIETQIDVRGHRFGRVMELFDWWIDVKPVGPRCIRIEKLWRTLILKDGFCLYLAAWVLGISKWSDLRFHDS